MHVKSMTITNYQYSPEPTGKSLVQAHVVRFNEKMARVEGPTRKQQMQTAVMGECGYCGKTIELNNKVLPLECKKCKGLYHVNCLRGDKPPVLLGDQLWVFTCAFCDPLGRESCVRPNLQWWVGTIFTNNIN